MAFLVIHGGPVSFGELAERLQVSRASISNNTRLLEQLGVIERVSKPGDRQDYFRLAEAPYQRLLAGVVERMDRARTAVDKAQRQLPADWSSARERLSELGNFYKAAGENTRHLIDRMRDEAD
jgi:DNA-binding transcriptional regulator GbsR (MarR family)